MTEKIIDFHNLILKFSESPSIKIITTFGLIISLISGFIIILNKIKEKQNLTLLKNKFSNFHLIESNSRGYTLQSNLKFDLYNNSVKSFTGDSIELFFKTYKKYGKYFKVGSFPLTTILGDGGKENLSLNIKLNKDIKNKILKSKFKDFKNKKEAKDFFNENVSKNFKIKVIIYKQNKIILKKYFIYKISELNFTN